VQDLKGKGITLTNIKPENIFLEADSLKVTLGDLPLSDAPRPTVVLPNLLSKKSFRYQRSTSQAIEGENSLGQLREVF